MRRPLPLVAALVLLLGVIAGAGAGVVPVAGQSSSLPGDRLLPAGPPSFAKNQLTWGKGSVIHYGGRQLSVAPYKVQSMLRTPYGFFVDLTRHWGGGSRLAYVTPRPGGPAKLTWLGARAQQVKVSPEGRLAGWIDFGGPQIVHGRSARLRIVDLKTGRLLFQLSSRRYMGSDTDAYEEAEPRFLGFDHEYAYWERVSSPRRMRTSLNSWATSRASMMSKDFVETPIGLPWDRLLGKTVLVEQGRPTDNQWATELGHLSVDGRWVLSTDTARLAVTDAETGRRVDPAYGGKWRLFMGYRDADTIFVMRPDRFTWGYDPKKPDGIRGWFLRCQLPSGECTKVRRFRDVHRIVPGTGLGD